MPIIFTTSHPSRIEYSNEPRCPAGAVAEVGGCPRPPTTRTCPRSIMRLSRVTKEVRLRGHLPAAPPSGHNRRWCIMHDRQLPAMDGPGTIRAHATTTPRSPSDVLIVAGEPARGPAPTAQVRQSASIAVARVSNLALVTWLVTALNATLAGTAVPHPRPVGLLIERGRFVAKGREVWAQDWYGHGRGCLLACCADEGSAATLAQQLETVLGGP